MRGENILLLDSYFNLVEWHGADIAQWVEEGHENNPDCAYLKQMLDTAAEDATVVRASRFPAPQFYRCTPGHSKERFIKSRLRARDEHQREGNLSDEADIHAFTAMLASLAVNHRA